MMSFDRAERMSILRERAATYVDVALENVTREYPHMPYFIAESADSYKLHREFHPAFYGSFDWHSCVEMHWVIVRLLRLFPDDVANERARATLDELLTAENIAAEADFFGEFRRAGASLRAGLAADAAPGAGKLGRMPTHSAGPPTSGRWPTWSSTTSPAGCT